jgi:hypothetical protein
MKIDTRGHRRWPRLLAAVACATAATVALPGTAAAAPEPPPAAARPAPAPPARAAARFADAAQRARTAWETHGRPNALVLVRPTGLDLVDQGRLTRRIPRATTVVTLPTLARYLPRGWLSVTGGTARLAAAVVLTPGVTLDVAAPVTTLQMVGGATAPEAASLSTGSGALALRGVTVTSVDRASDRVGPPGPGRPYLLVSPRGRFTATDSTIGDLGDAPAATAGAGGGGKHPGVDFHAGSTGSLVRTTFLRNGTGLQLDGARNVHLEDVTVSGSAGDGLVLRGDRGTTMSGVRAERNAGSGVKVTGPSTDRPVTGVTTRGNGAFGIGVDRQTGLAVTDVTTAGDAGGGLELEQSSRVTVTGLTTVDEPVGVFTHVNNTDITLDRLTSTGGRRAVLVEKTTRRLTVQDSTVARATVAGLEIGGTEVTLRDVAVTDSRTGVRVERGADGVTATRLTLTGGQDGVVATPGTARLLLQDLRADGVADDAVRSASPDARIVGGRITGGSTGVAVDAATTISGTSIGLVDQGIRTSSPGLVRADDIEVNAVSVGINSGTGSPLLLTGSRVHALEAVRGTVDAPGGNDLSLPPLNLLGAIGMPLVLLAVVLQGVAVVRGRRYGGDLRRSPPTLPVPAPSPGPAATPERSVRRGLSGSSARAA